MTDAEILANAPCKTWTHTEHLASSKSYYLKKLKNGLGFATWLDGGWQNITVSGNVRCRKDIERIVERENKINSLLSLIYNTTVGYVAMGVPVDIESMAQTAYEITGINAEQIK